MVATMVLKPLADAPVTEGKKRLQIVDLLALMVYVQIGLAVGIGPWDRVAGAVCVVACMLVLWAIAVGTSMHLGIVSNWRRFVLEFVLIPATAVLCCFTLISVSLIFETPPSQKDAASWHLGAIAAVASATYGLRKLAVWIVAQPART